jgi:hypothetical protein
MLLVGCCKSIFSDGFGQAFGISERMHQQRVLVILLVQKE